MSDNTTPERIERDMVSKILAHIDSLEENTPNSTGISGRHYCRYIDKLSKKECLGWEQKVADGKFGKKELDAHTDARESYGQHRGAIEAFSEVREYLNQLQVHD